MKGIEEVISLSDGTSISCRIRENGSAIWILATHGIGEHFRRHNYLMELFGQYFNIFQYDLRGHGKSSGKRGSIEDFDIYRRDLIELTEILTEKYRIKRLILFGHSMGALITAGHVQQYPAYLLYPELVFLSAPPIGTGGLLGGLVNALPSGLFAKAAKLKDGIYLGGLVDLKYLSHEAHVKPQYIADPLNCLKLDSKLLFKMVDYSRVTFSRPLNCRSELYCAVGSADQIVSPDHIEEYFTLVEKNSNLLMVEGAYHEMHNEVDRYRSHYFKFLKEAIMNKLLKDEKEETL